MTTLNLRGYQEKAISMLRDAMRQGYKRPSLQLPTGSGKTIIAVSIIQSALAKGKRVAFIVDRLGLVEQTARKLQEYCVSFGVFQGQHELNDY